jgi:DNA (cytosine-5)-methyltransferase 1
LDQPSLTAVGVRVGCGAHVIGLDQAGFRTVQVLEPDPWAARTLAMNVRNCHVVRARPTEYDPRADGIGQTDLLYARMLAERPRDTDDEMPVLLSLTEAMRPRALLIETSTGFFHAAAGPYRDFVQALLEQSGYTPCIWSVYEAANVGGPSPHSSAYLVAVRNDLAEAFQVPHHFGGEDLPTAYELLAASMKKRLGAWPDGRHAYAIWQKLASMRACPPLVGLPDGLGGWSSNEDEGRLRSVEAWHACGVDITRIVGDPQEDLRCEPWSERGLSLTVGQAALVRGLPPHWVLSGPREEAYRQVVLASSPAVARLLGSAVAEALRHAHSQQSRSGAGPTRNPARRAVVVPGASGPQKQAPEAHDGAPLAVREHGIVPGRGAQNGPGWSVAALDALHHSAFEQLVAGLMDRDGFRVYQAGGGAGDGGIDIAALDDMGFPVIVQCKHFRTGLEKPVAVGAARDLFGAAAAASGPTPRPLLVTNGRFTNDCRKWSTHEDRVRLIDGTLLHRWANGEHLNKLMASTRPQPHPPGHQQLAIALPTASLPDSRGTAR